VSLSSSLVTSEHAHSTLLFYIHGPCASHITNLITGLEPTDSLYIARLTHFFYPYYSLLPNFASESASCKPTAFLATDWSHDPLAGYGSYTNFQTSPVATTPEQEVHLDKDIEALREGVSERGIYFAGEHTAPFLALGTVTGAWWSGQNVAMRLFSDLAEAIEVEEHQEIANGRKGSVQVGKGNVEGMSIAKEEIRKCE
jgi:hypothetical protein